MKTLAALAVSLFLLAGCRHMPPRMGGQPPDPTPWNSSTTSGFLRFKGNVLAFFTAAADEVYVYMYDPSQQQWSPTPSVIYVDDEAKPLQSMDLWTGLDGVPHLVLGGNTSCVSHWSYSEGQWSNTPIGNIGVGCNATLYPDVRGGIAFAGKTLMMEGTATPTVFISCRALNRLISTDTAATQLSPGNFPNCAAGLESFSDGLAALVYSGDPAKTTVQLYDGDSGNLRRSLDAPFESSADLASDGSSHVIRWSFIAPAQIGVAPENTAVTWSVLQNTFPSIPGIPSASVSVHGDYLAIGLAGPQIIVAKKSPSWPGAPLVTLQPAGNPVLVTLDTEREAATPALATLPCNGGFQRAPLETDVLRCVPQCDSTTCVVLYELAQRCETDYGPGCWTETWTFDTTGSKSLNGATTTRH